LKGGVKMFMICWVDYTGKKGWEIIDGEDAMQQFVSEKSCEYAIDEESILVFPMESEYK